MPDPVNGKDDVRAAIDAAWAEHSKRVRAEVQQIWEDLLFGGIVNWEDEYWEWQQSRPPEILFVYDFGFDLPNGAVPGSLIPLRDWNYDSKLETAIRNFSSSAAAFLRHILSRPTPQK